MHFLMCWEDRSSSINKPTEEELPLFVGPRGLLQANTQISTDYGQTAKKTIFRGIFGSCRSSPIALLFLFLFFLPLPKIDCARSEWNIAKQETVMQRGGKFTKQNNGSCVLCLELANMAVGKGSSGAAAFVMQLSKIPHSAEFSSP